MKRRAFTRPERNADCGCSIVSIVVESIAIIESLVADPVVSEDDFSEEIAKTGERIIITNITFLNESNEDVLFENTLIDNEFFRKVNREHVDSSEI